MIPFPAFKTGEQYLAASITAYLAMNNVPLHNHGQPQPSLTPHLWKVFPTYPIADVN